MDTIFDGEVPRARLALLLRHFSELKDNREPWRIVYPLQEVLLLVTCATIASCDDFDDIVAWGSLCGIRSLIHLDAFLRNTSAIINRSRTSSSRRRAPSPASAAHPFVELG